MTKPKLLDLFCCQGGAGKGYADAGFDVAREDKGTAWVARTLWEAS